MINSTGTVPTSATSDVSSGTTHAHIAIVGAGPRGTSVLERLCASARDLLTPSVLLTVHLIDPSPPGPGHVWRTKQSSELLMNTVTSQMTLFTDDSIVCDGPIRPGPSLYTWSKDAGLGLGPDDYSGRAQYGQYLEWVFGEILQRTPPEVKVEVHTARAVSLDDAPHGRQTLTLSNGRTLFDLSAVVLAQGHVPLHSAPDQEQHDMFAKQHGLRYISPSNPADIDLSSLAPGEPVLLRGLGLNFFDYMALLTVCRGGNFTRTADGALRYHPSGEEPQLYAGSRRGIPYQARGDNAKGAYGRYMPNILTEDVIDGFRKRTDSGDAPDFLSEIWPLVAKEVELVYYENLLGGRHRDGSERTEFRNRFLSTPHDSPEEAQFLDELSIPEADRWSWKHIQWPYRDRTFESASAWQDWLLPYLREDAMQAAQGNVDGALKAALDVLRDLRNELRLIVDHGGLSGASRREHLDHWYTPFNAFLSIGPPRERIEQMVALMEAGILHVLGPRLSVQAEDGAWFASSLEIPNSTVRVTTLIEARLPEPDLQHTADDLLEHLFKTGQSRPHAIDGYVTGGMDVTLSPYHLVDEQGRAHARRFAIGVPTEGVHWVTAAGARPGVNSVTLTDSDAVARAALHITKAETNIIKPLPLLSH